MRDQPRAAAQADSLSALCFLLKMEARRYQAASLSIGMLSTSEACCR